MLIGVIILCADQCISRISHRLQTKCCLHGRPPSTVHQQQSTKPAFVGNEPDSGDQPGRRRSHWSIKSEDNRVRYMPMATIFLFCFSDRLSPSANRDDCNKAIIRQYEICKIGLQTMHLAGKSRVVMVPLQ